VITLRIDRELCTSSALLPVQCQSKITSKHRHRFTTQSPSYQLAPQPLTGVLFLPSRVPPMPRV